MNTLIDPYRISTPFWIVQNKFLTINEKLFASRTQVKQFTCLGSPHKKALLTSAQFCSGDPTGNRTRITGLKSRCPLSSNLVRRDRANRKYLILFSQKSQNKIPQIKYCGCIYLFFSLYYSSGSDSKFSRTSCCWHILLINLHQMDDTTKCPVCGNSPCTCAPTPPTPPTPEMPAQ